MKSLNDEARDAADNVERDWYEDCVTYSNLKQLYMDGFVKAVEYMDKRKSEGIDFTQIAWELKILADEANSV